MMNRLRGWTVCWGSGQRNRVVMIARVLTAIALSSVACQAAPSPEPELPEVTLKPVAPPPSELHCAIASDSPALAPIYVASELGYFTDEGVDVDITEVDVNSLQAQKQLLGRLLESGIDCVAQSVDAYMRARDNQPNLETAIIATLYTSTGADALVVTEAIASLEDLLDQRIGGDRHHPGILITYHAMRELGYAFKDIVVTPTALEQKAAEMAKAADEAAASPSSEPNTDTPSESATVGDDSNTTEAGTETVSADPSEATIAEEATAAETETNDAEKPPEESAESAAENTLEADTEDDAPSPLATLFQDENVVAIAASEPALTTLLADTSEEGSRRLLSSADFGALLTETLIIEQSSLEKNSDRYQRLLRGIYQAIALYNSDRPQFLQVAAPYFDQSPQELAASLKGVAYTSYAATQELMGTELNTGTLFQSFSDLNMIHIELDLQERPMFYDDHVEPGLIQDLFDP